MSLCPSVFLVYFLVFHGLTSLLLGATQPSSSLRASTNSLQANKYWPKLLFMLKERSNQNQGFVPFGSIYLTGSWPELVTLRSQWPTPLPTLLTTTRYRGGTDTLIRQAGQG